MSRSIWESKTEPSSALKDFLLKLFNRNNIRNAIATNIKIAMAINVISINQIENIWYLSLKRRKMGTNQRNNE